MYNKYVYFNKHFKKNDLKKIYIFEQSIDQLKCRTSQFF